MKVTAIVLWALVLAGMIVTAAQLRGLDQKIRARYEHSVDRLAYFAGQTLHAVPALTPAIVPALARYNESQEFSAIELDVDGISLLVGKQDTDAVAYRREIAFRFRDDAANLRYAKLTAYHPPLTQLVAQERKAMLVPLIAGFLVFGLLLALILRFVLTRPFGYMVATARAITQDGGGICRGSGDTGEVRDARHGLRAGLWHRQTTATQRFGHIQADTAARLVDQEFP